MLGDMIPGVCQFTQLELFLLCAKYHVKRFAHIIPFHVHMKWLVLIPGLAIIGRLSKLGSRCRSGCSRMHTLNHSVPLLHGRVRAGKQFIPCLHIQSRDTLLAAKLCGRRGVTQKWRLGFLLLLSLTVSWPGLALLVPLDLSSLLYEMRGKAWPHSQRTMLCCLLWSLLKELGP